ncbi:hypothetical protein WJX77_007521 [Trebouxia sp. C0004]
MDSQKHQGEGERLLTLQTVLKQNDPYRLKKLLPLLELLHHYCINQHSNQHAAEFIGGGDCGASQPHPLGNRARFKPHVESFMPQASPM